MTPWEWDEEGQFWFNRETGEELTPQELMRKHVDFVTRADALAEAAIEESSPGWVKCKICGHRWRTYHEEEHFAECALAAYREETK
jgi:hypothetical protein